MFRNKRRLPAAAFAGGLVVLVALAGCKKEPSMASKSAAAFQEAQKRGETIGGGAHGGHGAMIPSGGHEMPGTATEDGSAAGHSGMPMAGMDHSKMEGMDHSKMGGMDHSKMGGMDHPSAGSPAVAAPVTVSPGQPAMTLRPDALDAPAPTAVADAQRSTEMSGGMGGMGGHGMGTYHQVDAGRGPGAYEGSEKQAPGTEPHQHDPAPPPPSGQVDRRKG